MKNIFPLADQIKNNIETFGQFEAAKLKAKEIPFTLYHYLAFGYLPRKILIKGIAQSLVAHNTMNHYNLTTCNIITTRTK